MLEKLENVGKCWKSREQWSKDTRKRQRVGKLEGMRSVVEKFGKVSWKRLEKVGKGWKMLENVGKDERVERVEKVHICMVMIEKLEKVVCWY